MRRNKSPANVEPAKPESAISRGPRANASDILAVLRDVGVVLTCDLQRNVYASFGSDGDNFARWLVGSEEFAGEVRRRYMDARQFKGEDGRKRDVPVTESDMKTVTKALLARGLSPNVKPRQHCFRVAELGNAVWIDLSGPSYRALKVASSGWSVRSGRAVSFIRPKGQLELPVPVQDATAMQRFRRLFGDIDERDFIAILCFMLMCLWSRGSFPILVLHGSEFARKSTVAKIVRFMTDPSILDLGGMPEKDRDMLTGGEHARLLVYDNVSELTDVQSDLLCLRADGATAAFRTNYSDKDLTILRSFGPSVLTGIDSLVGRADLASRCIFIKLSEGNGKGFLSNHDVHAELAAIRPGVLAYLLDALVVAMGRMEQGQVQRTATGRLAMYEILSRAAAPALEVSDELMAEVFARQQRLRHETVVDNDPVAGGLLDWLATERGNFLERAGQLEWKGTLTGLLGLLNEKAPAARWDKSWPKHIAQLSRRLRRLQRVLAGVGVTVTFRHVESAANGWQGKSRWLEITQTLPDAPISEGQPADDPNDSGSYPLGDELEATFGPVDGDGSGKLH